MKGYLLITFVLLSVILEVFPQSVDVEQILYCYQCDNCGNPFDREAYQAQQCQMIDSSVPTVPHGINTTPILLPDGENNPGTGGELFPNTINTNQDIMEPFNCFIMTRIVDDGTEQTQRGCAQRLSDDTETCLSLNNGQTPVFCQLCNYSECNGSTKINGFLSIIILAIGFFIIS